MRSINVLNQKSVSSLWSTKQLEPFITKLLNRDSYDGIVNFFLNEVNFSLGILVYIFLNRCLISFTRIRFCITTTADYFIAFRVLFAINNSRSKRPIKRPVLFSYNALFET